MRVANELGARGQRVYPIPEGGSNPLGAFGYVRCAEELAEQLPPAQTTLVYACGSGGTGAGLIMGVKLLDLPCRVVGVNVCESREYSSAPSARSSSSEVPLRPHAAPVPARGRRDHRRLRRQGLRGEPPRGAQR